jgi:tRNA threonylcarbamoyladenosine biosynthesis protein TsaE
MNAHDFALADAAATGRLGAALARALGEGGAVLYLSGELGAGKTTLARALLQALGYAGHVRSPTYTLVEPYELQGRRVFHLDLYRLAAAEELEYLGLRDLDPAQDLILVEWPERGQGALPAADIEVRLAYAQAGRQARLLGVSERGTTILSGIGETAPPIQ